jgi:hypothetical protein
MKKTLTLEDRKRIYQSINETIKLITKENNYSADLRKYDYLNKLENHLNNLYQMLEKNEIVFY